MRGVAAALLGLLLPVVAAAQGSPYASPPYSTPGVSNLPNGLGAAALSSVSPTVQSGNLVLPQASQLILGGFPIFNDGSGSLNLGGTGAAFVRLQPQTIVGPTIPSGAQALKVSGGATVTGGATADTLAVTGASTIGAVTASGLGTFTSGLAVSGGGSTFGSITLGNGNTLGMPPSTGSGSGNPYLQSTTATNFGIFQGAGSAISLQISAVNGGKACFGGTTLCIGNDGTSFVFFNGGTRLLSINNTTGNVIAKGTITGSGTP